MANYFNTLNLRQQLAHWANAALWRATNSPMAQATFRVKVVIVGCGAQGLNRSEHA